MLEFQSLIDTLFELQAVRYAVVSNSVGDRITGGMKQGVQTISSPQMEMKLERQAVLILNMAENFEPENGRLYFVSVRWDKVVALFFLLSQDHALTITVNGDAPLQDLFEIERSNSRMESNTH